MNDLLVRGRGFSLSFMTRWPLGRWLGDLEREKDQLDECQARHLGADTTPVGWYV
jgi:hypothetical protein